MQSNIWYVMWKAGRRNTHLDDMWLWETIRNSEMKEKAFKLLISYTWQSTEVSPQRGGKVERLSAFLKRLAAHTTKLHHFEVLGELFLTRNEKKWYFSSRFDFHAFGCHLDLVTKPLSDKIVLKSVGRRWPNVALASHQELVTHSLFKSKHRNVSCTNEQKDKETSRYHVFLSKENTDQSTGRIVNHVSNWFAFFAIQIIVDQRLCVMINR